ncbi:hypothetical protein [Pasteurella oralis]|uniref:hypothetical protein n=1 Tax=Pasteurella oralis TaxID=1071947 RepID=UPI000C7B53D7|nr:hypothetical protein [Pasteurella oralis]
MSLSKKNIMSLCVNLTVGLFFIFILTVKGRHNIAPIFGVLIGAGYFITFFLRRMHGLFHRLVTH